MGAEMDQSDRYINVELVVIDIDGTLLNSERQLTSRTEYALKRAMATGVKVILATGKTRAAARDII